MAVNGPNEWSEPDELREWLGGLVDRVGRVDRARLSEPDRGRVTRALAAAGSVVRDGGGDARHAAESVREELRRGEPGRGGSARADDVVRTCLAVVLAARSAEVREVGADGSLVVTAGRQVAECRALAGEIVALSPHPELIAFAGELRRRLAWAQRWRWVEPDALTSGVVALAVLLLPFVGSAVGNAAVTVAGVLVGAVLVFGFVVAHRRRQWAVDEPGHREFRRTRV
ncbi:MAG: hypothetical protein HOV94_02450 [Saccharothrix sp.]|nr:hypothetical protein [Saccharothrix sp.]